MSLHYILFPLGFVLLIKGADYLISGSVSIAHRFKISDLIIGLTVIAMGTSLPEMVVNIIASVNNKGDIVFSNILGSNIANILLVLGLTALIKPIGIQLSTLKKEVPLAFLIILLVYFLLYGFTNAKWLQKQLIFTSINGYILLGCFITYLVYIFYKSKNTCADSKIDTQEEDLHVKSLTFTIIIIVISILAISFGGKFVVEGAIYFARLWGISEKFIALSIVALGTSLPELVTSIIAAKRSKTDFIIGGIIGSNIFNILWVLGLSSAIKSIAVSTPLLDLSVAFLSAFLLFIFLFAHKENKLGYIGGSIFLISYFSYIYVSYSL